MIDAVTSFDRGEVDDRRRQLGVGGHGRQPAMGLKFSFWRAGLGVQGSGCADCAAHKQGAPMLRSGHPQRRSPSTPVPATA